MKLSKFIIGFISCVLVLVGMPLWAIDNDTCLDCHDDPGFETERGGKTISLHVDNSVFLNSVHGELECIDCHEDADVEELPHDEFLARVNCGNCHDDVQLNFDASIHGQALNRKEPFAPRCADCHAGSDVHGILPVSDPNSTAYKMRVPYTCGRCHREGAPVASTYRISEHNIIENYSQSIHGEGLFKKGLTVTATCIDCHRSHLILPHTEPRASISRRNIASTCMQCHSRIEDVHQRVIRGELWEKSPGAIPACTDCHLPHKARKETVALTVSDMSCLECHERTGLYKTVGADSISMHVDKSVIAASVHRNIPCVKCHSDIDPRRDRPCEPSGLVDCSPCHAKISEEYFASGHGEAYLKKEPEAPYCTTCHGSHGAKANDDEESLTYRANVPAMCGDCHHTGGAATRVADLAEENALVDY
ncbi:MAG: cytochrome c3 family protein, partial [Candidatus Latescibacterota bacterium]